MNTAEVANGVLSLVLAQGPQEPPVVAGGRLESVWDFVVKGGPTMAVIVVCSLGALTVVVERFVVLRRGAVIPRGFLDGLKGVWPDRERALALARGNPSSIARILEAAVSRRGEGAAAVEKAVEDAGRREVVRLRHRMRLLGSLPQVSTMLGLLGTIFGMIKTFQAVATSGQALGKTELLAKGIFEAWTNTAAGLLVAIPVMVLYQMLMGRIDARVAELDRVAEEWVRGEGAIAAPVAAPAGPPASAVVAQAPVAAPAVAQAAAPSGAAIAAA
jgi:biopolymer transport protein ExbB